MKETSEEKLERLREERKQEMLAKYRNEEFYISDTGGLSRYGWGKNIFFSGMPVKVKKPDGTWRRGEIEYIKIENKLPKIGVVCGKNKIKFEKTWGEVTPDKTLEDIALWENLQVPENLRKMDTVTLLKRFKKIKKSIRNTEEEEIYKKELYLREHVGFVDSRKIRQKKAKEKNDKRH